jgi:hypothetical protein
MNLPLLALLVAVAGSAGTACLTSPSKKSDGELTSCGGSGVVGQGGSSGGVAPDFRSITGVGGGVTLSVGRTAQLTTCFYRDLDRPQERAAIVWSVSDPTLASVSPSTGPSTTVTGLAYGKTRIRALITGVTVENFVVICDATGCPPPPY